MDDMQGGRCGPQLYLLSQDGYEALKHLQDMLDLMALITYNDEHMASGDTTITMGRAELYFIFQAIHTQIDDVLERLGNENWLGIQSASRQ
ncbi:MAG TPA: hypothetical protein VJP80_00420 [Candidatus Saccharimonadales bacterium]|nr:hypothetical protein [Candidatus Saccharimonadales bacterium]